MPQPVRENFRHDINGLRAVAVTEVLFFHLGLPGFPGGFSGVDVFYAISGYLMTQIIWTKLEAGRFSLWDFYGARARRIVPALVALCGVLILFGYFGLDPITYRTLGINAASSLGFVSNILYWRQSGYFEPSAAQNILLHTWSLSLEWQFYLIYPIALLVLRRFCGGGARHVVLASCAVSLALSVVATPWQPSLAFYLLPARAWEMLLGGLVFLYPLPRAVPAGGRAGLVALGFAAMLGSLFLLDDYVPWPSYWAIPAVLGACLVLAAAGTDWLWCRNPIVSVIGRISYSIYLWHWPIIVLVNYDEVAITPAVLAMEILAAVMCGWLSHRFIESGAWKRFIPTRTWPRLGSASLYAAVLGCTLIVIGTAGFPSRHGLSPALVADYEAADADWSYWQDCHRGPQKGVCQIGAPDGARKILVIGDSFAEQLSPRFAALARGNPALSINFLTLGGCPPVPGVELIGSVGRCGAFEQAAYAEAESGHYETIVIASVWAPYFYVEGTPFFQLTSAKRSRVCMMAAGRCERSADPALVLAQYRRAFDALGQVVGRLSQQGRRVVLVLPTPYEEFNPPQVLLKRMFLGRPTGDLARIDLSLFKRKTEYVDDQLRRIALGTGAVLVDPTEFLCHDDSCPTMGGDRRSIYKDQAHIRSSVIASLPLGGLDDRILGPGPLRESVTQGAALP